MTCLKFVLSFLFIFLFLFVHGQNKNFISNLENGKIEFQKEFDEQDYGRAAHFLEKAVQLKKNNAEAHYFLGYAYSRLNSKDGSSMIHMDKDLVLKSSAEFEKVIALSPKYNGEKVVLDPYSKLTAEWGSLAMNYWYKNKMDSVRWALNEGRKRGGFSDYILALNRKVLESCSNKAMLISSGDNFTIPLWYLQIAENYRTDVSVIDITLLNTNWYPAFLRRNGLANFEAPQSTLDTINYIRWSDSTIRLGNFFWVIKASYDERYLLRGDRIFLSMLMDNKFERDLYFTTGFPKDAQLSLSNYLHPKIIVDELSFTDVPQLDYDDYKMAITKLLKLSNLININSVDQVFMLDFLRFNLISKADYYINEHQIDKAEELLKIMDRLAPESSYPFEMPKGKEYSTLIRKRL